MGFIFEKEMKIRNSRHSYSVVKISGDGVSCYITCGFCRNERNKYEIEVCGVPLPEDRIIALIDDLYWESGSGFNFEDGDIGVTEPGGVHYFMRHVEPTDFLRDERVQGYYDNDHEDLYRLRVVVADAQGRFPWNDGCDPDYAAQPGMGKSDRKFKIHEVYKYGQIHHFVTEGMKEHASFEIEMMKAYPPSLSRRILNRICNNIAYGTLASNNKANIEYKEKTKIADKSTDSANVINSLSVRYVETDGLDESGERRYRAVLTDERGRWPWDALCAVNFRSQLTEEDMIRAR